MKFRNVKVPEGINVSRHSPLVDLVLLSGGVLAIAGLLGLAVVLFGGTLARNMPLSWENALADAVFQTGAEALEDPEPEATRALQSLADRLAAEMDLPEGLAITVHYLDDPGVNAFASLGGHVFVLRGLIERMPSENALAMVMAHEIAHAAHRDAIGAMGGALLLQLALGVVLGAAPDGLEDLVMGPNALLLLAFGREAERAADRAGLAAVAGAYGHVAGAARIFELFLEEAAAQGQGEPLAILGTHPLGRERIAALAALAEAEGWPLDGEAMPLAPALARLAEAP